MGLPSCCDFDPPKQRRLGVRINSRPSAWQSPSRASGTRCSFRTDYLTTMTLETAPSAVLPLNLLLLADSAVPAMAVALLKNSLFEIRSAPPAAFTPTTLLAKVLLATFTWQPVLART